MSEIEQNAIFHYQYNAILQCPFDFQEFAADIKRYTKEHENDEVDETKNKETDDKLANTGEISSLNKVDKETDESTVDDEEQKLLEKGII